MLPFIFKCFLLAASAAQASSLAARSSPDLEGASLIHQLKDHVRVRFSVFLSDAASLCTLDSMCAQLVAGITGHISRVLELQTVESVLAEIGFLARLIASQLDEQHVAIEGVVASFDVVTSHDLQYVRTAISHILTASWATEWSPAVSACVVRIEADVRIDSDLSVISNITRTHAPVPLLMYMLASGLFLGAKDYAMALSRFVAIPDCALIAALDGLENIDYVEPPGTTESVESFNEAWLGLPEKVHILLHPVLPTELIAQAQTALVSRNYDILEAFVNHRRRDVTSIIEELIELLYAACTDSEECRAAVEETFSEVIRTADLITDSGDDD